MPDSDKTITLEYCRDGRRVGEELTPAEFEQRAMGLGSGHWTMYRDETGHEYHDYYSPGALDSYRERVHEIQRDITAAINAFWDGWLPKTDC